MSRPQERQRAVQQRAEETKEAILTAATDLFSTQGFDGTSIRAIEAASGTKRGLVNYHFGDKDSLWRAVATRLFTEAPGDFEPPDIVQDLGPEVALRAQLTQFVRFSAAHPEVSRLIIQEGKTPSWRLDYLVDTFVQPRLDAFNEILGTPVDAHTLYMFIGAATLVFDVEAECEKLFGYNPRTEAFVSEHARRLCDLILSVLPDN